MNGPSATNAADRQHQKSVGARVIEDAQLHWQCVAICLDHRHYSLKAIERHRLNQFIALHHGGRRIRQPQRYAVLRIIAACKARRRASPSEPTTSAQRRRTGRKRLPKAPTGAALVAPLSAGPKDDLGRSGDKPPPGCEMLS